MLRQVHRVVGFGLAFVFVFSASVTPSFAQLKVEAQSLDEAPAQGGLAELVLDMQGFASQIFSLAFSPDEKYLAAAGGKEVRVWDLSTGELHVTLRGQRERNDQGNCYAVTFTRDGSHLLVGVSDHSEAGSIRVYDTKDFQLQDLMGNHRAPCRKLAFSSDGKYLASAGDNGKVTLWRWPARRPTASIEPRDGKQPLYYVFEFPSPDVMVTLDAQGPRLTSAPLGRDIGPGSSLPAEVKLWRKTMPSVVFPQGDTSGEISLGLDRGYWLASGHGKGDGKAAPWAATWRNGDTDPVAVYRQHDYIISALALSPTGAWAASGDLFGAIHVWDSRTANPLWQFEGQGGPLYAARFEHFTDGKHRIQIAARPHTGAAWGYNAYGTPDLCFDFERRSLNDVTLAKTPAAQSGSLKVGVEKTGLDYFVATKRRGSTINRYRVRAGAVPTAFATLPAQTLGLEAPVLFGDDGGLLSCFNPLTDYARRDFIGHEMMITGMDVSADGRFLVTSAVDRTVRIWSLTDFQSFGDLDCKLLSDEVIEVKPGSFSAKAGVKVGDRFVSMEGLTLTELANAKLKGTYPFQPHQKVNVKLQRGGRPLTLKVTLHEDADVVEPLLNLFITLAGKWIAWTPQGYYDASPGADDWIVWHINQGIDIDGKSFPLSVFKKRLYRPDVIDEILRLGNGNLGISAANRARGIVDASPDPRDVAALMAAAPPDIRSVKITPTTPGRVRLSGIVESQNDLPVRSVNLIIGGRPTKLETSGQTDKRRTFEQEIELPVGRQEVHVVASNTESTSSPQRMKLEYRPSSPDRDLRGELYVLAIGVGVYKSAEMGTLQFPARDAGEFAATMRAQQGGLYRAVQTKVLADDQASRLNILAGFDWLVESVTQHDMAMIFVSAHGVRDARNNYYLGCHEIEPANLRATGVPYNDIMKAVQDLPCKVLVFADTCHSGGITGAKGIDDPLRDLVAAETGAILFCSSTPREVSHEHADWGHGAFTKALLDSIRDPNSDIDDPQDRHLSVTELDGNLTRRVKKLTNGQQHPVTQKPSTIRDFNVVRIHPAITP